MAETVNKNLELLSFEIHDLKESTLFSDAECTAVTKKLEHFQYRIGRITKDLQDFKCMIEYLVKLLKEVGLRISRDHTKSSTNLRTRLMNKINFYYEQGMHFFPYDKDLALEYLDFINNNPFLHVSIPARINNIIKRFHTEPEIFQIAACWYRKTDNRKAIDILLKGLSHHRSDHHLYLDIIELELHEPELKNEEARFKTYIDSIHKDVNDCHILIHILKMLFGYSRLFTVKQYIMDILVDKYRTDENVWNAIALLELKGCYYKATAEDMNKQSSRRSLKRSVNRFREGLKAIPEKNQPALWRMYLDTLHDNYDKEDVVVKQIYENTLKNLFQDALNQKIELEEHHWKAWMDYCKDENEIINVLINATEHCPKSVDMWLLRLKFYLQCQSFNRAIETFSKAILQLGEDSYPIWDLYAAANLLHKFTDIYELYRHGATQPYPKIATSFKVRHINWAATYKSMDDVRKLYEQYSTVPNQLQCKEVYETMLRIERTQRNVSYVTMSKVFQRYAKHFGHDNMNIWKNWANLCAPCDGKSNDEIHRRQKLAEMISEHFREILKELSDEIRKNVSSVFYETIKQNLECE